MNHGRKAIEKSAIEPTHSNTKQRLFNISPIHFADKVLPRNDIDSHLKTITCRFQDLRRASVVRPCSGPLHRGFPDFPVAPVVQGDTSKRRSP
jgi:hypothetical protein